MLTDSLTTLDQNIRYGHYIKNPAYYDKIILEAHHERSNSNCNIFLEMPPKVFEEHVEEIHDYLGDDIWYGQHVQYYINNLKAHMRSDDYVVILVNLFETYREPSTLWLMGRGSINSDAELAVDHKDFIEVYDTFDWEFLLRRINSIKYF